MREATWKLDLWLWSHSSRITRKAGHSFDQPEPLPGGARLPGRTLDHTQHLAAPEAQVPLCSCPSVIGRQFPRGDQCHFPLTRQRAAGPQEAEGTSSAASVHSSGQGPWPWV